MANLIVVSVPTDLNRLVDQIREFVRRDESVVLIALGTDSLFVAVMAIGIARYQLAADYLEVIFVTELSDYDQDGNQRSALRVYAPRADRWIPRLPDLPIVA